MTWVMATSFLDQTHRKDGPEGRLVVMRTVEAGPETHYALSKAGPEVTLPGLVRVRFTRHRIEVFGAGKGEVGLAQYEVRSWAGWHRHMALSLLALWSLCCERRRVGGGDPGGDRVAGARGLHPAAARPGAEPGAERRGGDAGLVAEGGGPDLQVARGHRRIPAPSAATRYQLIR